MKKFAICVMVLMVAAAFVPNAQAAAPKTYCYVLTNFCDGIQMTQIHVGGIQGTESVGLWDWLCLKAGTGSLMAGGVDKFGTQPLYPYSGGTGSGFSANFTFNKVKGFDLYGTFDGATANAFQTSQPYTKQAGACNPLAPRTGRSATGR